MTHRLTSGRDGTSNMEFSRMSSMMLFSPRAPVPDEPLQAVEGATTDEEDVGGVDLDEVLMGVLAATLWGNIGDRALEDLQQRLLDTLARDVAGDRGVIGLARDLVDLVDVDDAALGAGDIEVGRLDQAEQDVLDVLADVTRLGQ